MLGGEREAAVCTRATTTNGHRRAREIRNKEQDKREIFPEPQAPRDPERCGERRCTHSGVGRAVGVTGVCGLRVVMQLFLVVGQIMLQTSGPLTTTAATGPTGAKAWTHGHRLTAAVTSDRCTGLVGRRGKGKNGEGGTGKTERLVRARDGEEERKCEAAQRQMYCEQPPLCSRQVLTTDCPLTDLHPN